MGTGRSHPDPAFHPSMLGTLNSRQERLQAKGVGQAGQTRRGVAPFGMAVVGDRVQISSRKIGEAPRDGVVTGVTGSLLRVRWSTGEESTVVSSKGSLAVVGFGQWRPQTADNECFCGEGPTQPVTRVESCHENVEECSSFLIRPDPRCPECAGIMDWRSAHRWIAITNGAKIRLSDNPLGIRHLHVRNLRVAHQKNRQLKERESKEHLHPVA
jgi:hypothetical protein